MEYKQSMDTIRAKRMDEVVKVASDLFIKNGIYNVSMIDIAKKSDIGVASLYRYFGTKTQLVIKAGEYLWIHLQKLFEGIFESSIFIEKSGIDQLHDLLKIFHVLYSAHSDFLQFLYDFDRLIIAENVEKTDLISYEKCISNTFPLFKRSYEKGVADKSVRPNIDIELYYYSVTHAILSTCQKFILGDIIKSDTTIPKEKQINQLIDIAVEYMRNKEK